VDEFYCLIVYKERFLGAGELSLRFGYQLTLSFLSLMQKSLKFWPWYMGLGQCNNIRTVRYMVQQTCELSAVVFIFKL